VFRSRVHQLKLGLLIAILPVAATCGPFGDDGGDPRFTIDVPPGHYAIRVQGHWPDHPSVTSTPIFVTWAFNVEVA
jgi:hypothetical protein